MSLIIPSPHSSIAFSIFDFQIKYYGIFLTAAIFTGLFFSYFLIEKRFSKQFSSDFIDYSPFLILFSIIGARLFYVLGDIDFYLDYPNEIICINHGGISIYGAICFAIISLFFYCKKTGKSFFKLCDCLAVVMPLCQAIGRWGNYFNQEAFGLPSDGFIKLFVDFKYRPMEYKNVIYFHPTFLYEGVLNLILFIFLLLIFFKAKNIKDGTIFSFYLIFYGLIRLLVESIRLDSVLNFNDIHVATIISFLIVLVGVVFFCYSNFVYKKNGR